METFLEELDALIAEQDLSVIEVVGALQYVQQRLVIDAYVDNDDDEEEDMLVSQLNMDISVETSKTVKITNVGGNIGFYYWTGSAWALVGASTVKSHSYTGNWYVAVFGNASTNGTGTVATVNNLKLVDTDFATQRP